MNSEIYKRSTTYWIEIPLRGLQQEFSCTYQKNKDGIINTDTTEILGIVESFYHKMGQRKATPAQNHKPGIRRNVRNNTT